ncbi:hypothetical protein ACFLXC_05960, partial [Chloroflexota bacterium]
MRINSNKPNWTETCVPWHVKEKIWGLWALGYTITQTANYFSSNADNYSNGPFSRNTISKVRNELFKLPVELEEKLLDELPVVRFLLDTRKATPREDTDLSPTDINHDPPIQEGKQNKPSEANNRVDSERSLRLLLKKQNGQASESQLPKLELKWISTNPAGTQYAKRMEKWPAHMIEEISNGRAKFKFYWANSLVPPSKMYAAIQDGIADMCWLFGGYAPGAFPVSDLFSLPGLFPNMSISNVIVNILHENYPYFIQQFSPQVKHLASQVMQPADLHFIKPIYSLDDVKDKTIGCHDVTSAKVMRMLGASAMVIPLSEMCSSGEKNLVDGVVVAWGAYGNW